MAKDRSKEILRELRSLRQELSTRLDLIEKRIGVDGASGMPGPSLPVREPGSGPHFSPPPDDPAQAAGGVASARRGPGSFRAPTAGEVQVIIRPLRDLGLARVVEEALTGTDGVDSATLRELRGDSATIDTRVTEGVSLISSLRRKLPVAFDVTDSDEDSVTIALAQPVAVREGGVATPQSQ